MPFPPARSGALQPCTEKESTPLLPPSTPRNSAASSSTPADSSNLDPFPRSPPASKDEYGANRGSGYGYEYRYQTFAPAAKPPIIVSRSASYTDKDERRRNSQPPPHRSSSMGLTPPTGLKGTANKDDVMIFTCFWLFGAIVVMQFGVVLTAANDLVGNSAPQGLILLAYTLPSILIRTFVPYIKFPSIRRGILRRRDQQEGKSDDGQVDYSTRLCVCAAASFSGLQMLAWCECVEARVLGIAFASLSSNLGDMSFIQLTTRYPASISQSMGGYAAGSGAAGLIGSFIYTFFTGSSVSASPASVLSSIGVVPCFMLIVYFFLLPSFSPTTAATKSSPNLISSLSLSDKLALVQPMILGHMLPLASLMFLENITTQGILPTLLWHLPLESGGVLNTVFKTTRDFYPFFFTIYQSAIFLGRSSINFFRLPGHNRPTSAAYWGLCFIELACVYALVVQSWSMADSTAAARMGVEEGMPITGEDARVKYGVWAVAAMIWIMGMCGGLGMGNTYWRVGKKRLPKEVWRRLEAIETGVKGRREEEGIWSCEVDEDRGVERDGLLGGRKKVVEDIEGEGSDAGSEETMVEEVRDEGDALLSEVELRGEDELGVDHLGSGRRWGKEEETSLREFLISTIAMPDVGAIFLASLLSLWVQPELCKNQVQAGRGLCKAAR